MTFGPLSRRTFLRRAPIAAVAAGAAVSSIALAVPAAEAVKPLFVKVGSPSRVIGAVGAAIAQHKRARRSAVRLGREWERLSALPGRPDPKVRYAWLLTVSTGDGDDIRDPLFAYSHEEIDKRLDEVVRARLHWGVKDVSKSELRRAALHRELTTLIRRERAFDRRSGLTAVGSLLDAAERHEAECAVAALLAMPATAKEAGEKAAYLKQHAHRWLGDDMKATILVQALSAAVA